MLGPATLLRKRFWYRYFPVNFVKFLRTSFYRTPLDDYFFLKPKLNLKSAQIQILFATCQRFTMVRIFDSHPGWKLGLTPFLGQPFRKNNSSSLGRRCLEENVWLRMRKEKKFMFILAPSLTTNIIIKDF